MRNRRLISVLLALALLLSSASFVSAQQPVPTSSQNLVPLADMPPKPTPPPPGCYPTEITPSLIKSATGVYLPHGGIHLEWDVDATCLPTEINILVRTEGSNNWTEIPKPPSGAWSPQDTTEYSPGWNTNFRIIATWGDRGVNKDLQVGIPFWGFGVTPLDKDGRVMSWYVSDSLSMISENRFIFNLAMRPGPNDSLPTKVGSI